ncbi:MAG: hypothetical protein IJW36_00135 [Clostridia bacterium]|nr:hypothetical protein [Clostridia bacterium]
MKREICEKCKYYIPHYINTKSSYFEYANYGHCSLNKTNQLKIQCTDFELALTDFAQQNKINIIRKIAFQQGQLISAVEKLLKQIDAVVENKNQ